MGNEADSAPDGEPTFASPGQNTVVVKTPRRWFLTTEPVSTECTVAWRVGYSAYYARIEQLISQTTAGDEILISAWLLHPAQTLASHTLEFMLTAAVGRGAKVRALISRYSSGTADNAIAAQTIVNLGGEAVLDDQALQIPGVMAGTFHQKAIYIRAAEGAHLFVGGADVAAGRIQGGRQCWLDVDAEITGRAAELGRATLEARWSSNTGDPMPPAFQAGVEKNITYVQFVRTYGKPDAHASARTYAQPDGDFSVHELLRHACETATATIYIEDQYFVGDRVNQAKPRGLDSLDDALAAAVKRGVEVVVVTNHSDQAEGQYTPWIRRKQLIALLTQGLSAADAGRVKVLQFQARYNADVWHNYVHTKAWIFDNEFAVVGSANYSRMSMTYEGEFCVGVTSIAAINVASALRKGLWLAVLNAPGTPGGFKDSDVVDWDTGRDALTGPNSPLEPYDPNAGTDPTSDLDPDGS